MSHLPGFLITVSTLIGTSFSIIAESSDSVYNLKERISIQEGLEESCQHILFGSKELKDNERLEEAGLYHGANVTLVLSMRVGPLKTKSVQLNVDAFDSDIEIEFDEEEDENVQLLLVKINGAVYLYPARKCNIFNRENIQRSPQQPTRWNRERFYENTVTKEKVNSLRKRMDIKKKMMTKTPENKTHRPSSALSKTARRTPRTFIRSHTYENARNALNLLKAEIYLQSKRNKTPGAMPYTHSQLAQYLRSKISILLEEQRNATGERQDYIPRPRSLVPTVLTRSIPVSPVCSSSSISLFDIVEDPGGGNREGNIILSSRRDQSTARHDRILEVCIKTCTTGVNGKTLSSTATKASTARRVPKKQKTPTPSVKRCAQCRKKLSVVNEYECRCGLLLCSTHRYAETHKCTFDYKEEGRRIIKEANPVVTAQKVQQI